MGQAISVPRMQKPPCDIFTDHFIIDFNVCGMDLGPILHNSKSLAWNNVAMHMVPPDVTAYTQYCTEIITGSLLLSSAPALELKDTASLIVGVEAKARPAHGSSTLCHL